MNLGKSWLIVFWKKGYVCLTKRMTGFNLSQCLSPIQTFLANFFKSHIKNFTYLESFIQKQISFLLIEDCLETWKNYFVKLFPRNNFFVNKLFLFF